MNTLSLEHISLIDWALHPLIPAIVQESGTQNVLMLAYMNKEALTLTLTHKEAYYYSRSKKRIWKKGEQSGHTQSIQEIWIDCDADCLLLKVIQKGMACHTLKPSCFFRRIDIPSINEPSDIQAQIQTYGTLLTLYHTIQERKNADKNQSYTASLFMQGANAIGKKIIEESAELSFALKDEQEKDIVHEAADLFYHTLVGLAFKNIAPEQIFEELQKRMGISGIEEKQSRKAKKE